MALSVPNSSAINKVSTTPCVRMACMEGQIHYLNTDLDCAALPH
jgi:hypothetical protein